MLRGWEKYGVGRGGGNEPTFAPRAKTSELTNEPTGGLTIGVGSLFIFFILGVRILGRFVFMGPNVFYKFERNP